MKDREKTRRRLMNRLDGLREGIDKLQEAISKFQKSEEQMQEKIIEYETLSALGRLTANVAHEIRNPITVIERANGKIKERLCAGTETKGISGSDFIGGKKIGRNFKGCSYFLQ